MFKENRLIYFSDTSTKGDSSDPDSTPKATAEPKLSPKEEREQAEKEAKAVKKQKIQELKKKVQNANISKVARDLAINSLNQEDEDEIALVEQLLESEVTQLEFEEKLADLRNKKKGLRAKKLPDITKEVADRSNKVAQIKKVAPEAVKKQAEFEALSKSLTGLSEQERRNQSEIEKLLAPLVKEHKLDSTTQAKIVNLDPESPDFTFYLKKYLGSFYDNKKLVDKILVLKNEQKEIIQEFNRQADKLMELLEQDQVGYNLEKDKYLRIKRLSKASGITISDSTKLEYLSLSNSLEAKRTIAKIENIEYKRVPSKYLDEETENSEDKKELEEEQLLMPNELFITVTKELEGRPVTETLSERDFLEWVNQMQVTELVPTLKDLENKINFSEFGQSLKAGTQLEYVSGLNASGNETFSSVKVLKIDQIKQEIHLDQAVPVVRGNLTRNDDILKQPRTKKVLSFGEFSKWFKANSAEEKMSLSEAKSVLKKCPTVYKLRYPDLDPGLWEFNTLPIELKPAEELTWGENKTVTINSVDGDNISLSNGKVYTPGQFVRFVKDNEVERASNVPSTEEVQAKLNEVLNNDNPDNPATSKADNTPEMQEQRGMLASMWKNTTFLSINDLIKVFHTVEEFFKRTTERNSKRRAAKIGKPLPGRLGLEFQNLAQASENEEVDKIQGDLKNQGVDDWRNALINAKGNTDIIKATTNLLCELGAYDFEDPAMWIAMNEAYREGVDEETYEENKINLDSRKNKAGRTAIDALKFIMDTIWGKPSGNNWFNQNKSAYNSEMGKFKEEANTIELAEGGYEAALHDMLTRHANGEYVSAARYEAYIRYIIETGKSSPEDKVYYLLAGYVAKNPSDGTYLLSKNKYGDINGLLNHMPHLDFFTRFPWIAKGTPEESRSLMSQIFAEFKSNLEPGWTVGTRYDKAALGAFLTEDVMTHKNVLVRISKILRNAREKLDHDDAHVVIPAMDSTNILQIIGNLRGSDSFLSTDGYAVGLRGFNNYLRSLGNVSMKSEEEIKKRSELGYKEPDGIMQQMFKSFLFYEASLTGRVKFGDYTILPSEKLDSMVGDTGLTLRQNANQVKEVLRSVLQAYGFSEKQIHLFLDFKSGKTNEAKNKDHVQEMMKFPNEFDKAIKSQGSGKMVAIVKKAVQVGKLVGDGGAIIKRDKSEDEEESKSSNTEEEPSSLRDPDDIMGDVSKKVNKAA